MCCGPCERPLYVIVDRDFAGDDARWLAWLAEIAAAARGAPILVQARAKGLPPPAFAALAARARDVARDGPPLVLNGDTGLAERLGYDGVHWPEAVFTDGTMPATSSLAYRTAAVHSAAAARTAESAGATALVFAPVFEPGSKVATAAGVDALRAAVAATTRPVYALGGVTPGRVSACRDAGAAGVAVVSGVLGAPSPGAAIDAYLRAMEVPAACR